MKMKKTLVLALIGGLIISFIACKNETGQLKEISRDGADIHYEMSGKGDTVLLFIHGSYIDQSYWKAQVDHFKKHYRVLTLDLPGHGLSGRQRNNWSLDGFSKDVNHLVKELKLDQVVLVAHSMGADIGLLAVKEMPKPYIGFIVLDYFKNVGASLPPSQVKGILAQLKTDFANTNEQYARTGLLTDKTPPQITARVVQDYRNAYEPMGQQIMPEIFSFYETEKLLLPVLSRKLYIISVDYMPLNEEPLRQFVTHGYKVLHMPGTSHFPMIENPAQLNELLDFCMEDMRH